MLETANGSKANDVLLPTYGIQPAVKVALINSNAIKPIKANPNDAGFDLHSTVRVDLTPGKSCLIDTGLKLAIPDGWCGQINPRSGIASKHKVVVGARVIDAGYRGELKINLINHGDETFEIKVGDRIAQILFMPVLGTMIQVTEEELGETERGDNGFGSSGLTSIQ